MLNNFQIAKQVYKFHIYMGILARIYIYIYTHTHICIYIYIHIYIFSEFHSFLKIENLQDNHKIQMGD